MALVAVASCVSCAAGTSAGPPAPDDVDLLSALRQGGLLIMFRHGATDRSLDDDEVVDFDDCTTQRVLTDEGRADAVSVGEAFRALQIPVGAVWTSPYCRSRDTAELAFGSATEVEGLERFFPERDEEADERVSSLVREHAPDVGEPNLVISGHGEYPGVLAPAVSLEEGEAAIYAVRSDDVALLGRVVQDGWQSLEPDRAGPLIGLSAVVDEVDDSVVAVQVDGVTTGSGFRVALPGIVITTATAVGEGERVEVLLRDGTRRPARVIGRSAEVDVAALEVDDSGLPPMHSKTGLADAVPGHPVRVVAAMPTTPEASRWSAFVADDTTTTATDTAGPRVVDFGAGLGAPEPTTAGAPLINTDGDVLGMVTTTVVACPTDDDEPTAIPVDVARDEVMRLIEDE